MAHSLLPGYQEFFELIKSKIQSSQIKAALAVNSELISMHWDIGKMIIEKKQQLGWGNAVVEQLAKDLKQEFPTLKGFSRSNLFTVRQWYLFYSVADEKVQQVVGQIPWGHHALLVSKVKNVEEAYFYMQKTIEQGWSRSILAHQIELNLYKRIGQATTNFTLTLPPVASDLAKQTLKDPYIFDFLSIGQEAHERELEKELTRHITKFLLELGAGFAFVGNQYHLEVAGDDFYIDLLFYHFKLKCFVAIDLKVGEFKPEYAGKMNFYLTALDKQVKSKEDKPSIGMILLKAKAIR